MGTNKMLKNVWKPKVVSKAREKSALLFLLTVAWHFKNASQMHHTYFQTGSGVCVYSVTLRSILFCWNAQFYFVETVESTVIWISAISSLLPCGSELSMGTRNVLHTVWKVFQIMQKCGYFHSLWHDLVKNASQMHHSPVQIGWGYSKLDTQYGDDSQ